jgi:hypothetical protein
VIPSLWANGHPERGTIGAHHVFIDRARAATLVRPPHRAPAATPTCANGHLSERLRPLCLPCKLAALLTSVSVQAPATASLEARADPARQRGLRRARSLAACPPVEPTSLPPPVDPVQVLALLTRMRAARVDAGELAPERLYDVRAFKCCYAELAYLRRLAAAGRAGGTVVTSMRQLVAGLAALHPAWEIAGEGFEDRDRHHRTVRRRLGDLQAMGLLRWRIGTDLEGEERRTELELRPPPELSVEELEAAAHKLERWQARYGQALNTGSRTGIRNAAGHGRPLSASERQRRGCQHARAAAASRARDRGHSSNSTPPSGAPPENTTLNESASELREASQRTGAHTHNAQIPEADTRAETPKTAGTEENGGGSRSAPMSSEVAVGSSEPAKAPVFDVEAILARVRKREAQRRPVLESIAAQAAARAIEVAGWSLDRAWPFSRLREAWVVARYGAMATANSGPGGAGPLYPEDYVQLRRAVARYERNHMAAPEGYPASGLGALLHLGALAGGAGELPGGPRTLRYAVGALDQLSRRMRAIATAQNASRHHTNLARARRRREQPPSARALQLGFRKFRWPAWVRTNEHGDPIFERGMLQLDHDARCGVPRVDSDAYGMTVRDAYLLAGLQLPVDVDGRKQMALRHQCQLDPAERRPRPSDEHLELAELAHRTGEPISLLRRISPSYRNQWLVQQRQEDAMRARAETIEFRQRIADMVAG